MIPTEHDVSSQTGGGHAAHFVWSSRSSPALDVSDLGVAFIAEVRCQTRRPEHAPPGGVVPIPPPGRFDAAELRRARQSAGLSRPQLAQRIGINASLIKTWETRGVCPTVGNITRAAQALGLKVSDLYTPDVVSAGSLRDLRVAAGMSQQDLAHRLEVRQELVSQWERAKARPTGEKIVHYAAALEVEPAVINAAINLTEARSRPPRLPLRSNDLESNGDRQAAEALMSVLAQLCEEKRIAADASESALNDATAATWTGPETNSLRWRARYDNLVAHGEHLGAIEALYAARKVFNAYFGPLADAQGGRGDRDD